MIGYEIALVNPRKRKRKGAKKMAKRRRKMTAKQLKYFGPRRRKASRTRSRSRRRSALPAVVTVSNPRRRRRSNPRVHHYSRRRRSNPRGMGGMMGQVTSTLMPAALGAAGVFAVDRVIGFLPLESLSSDAKTQRIINRAARLVAVAGVGVAARKFLGNERGRGIAVAAMGVALHGLLAGFFGSGVGLSGALDGDEMGADDDGAPLDVDDLNPLNGDELDTLGIYTNARPVLEGIMDGDDLAAYMSGVDMDGDDPLGAYMGADDDVMSGALD